MTTLLIVSVTTIAVCLLMLLGLVFLASFRNKTTSRENQLWLDRHQAMHDENVKILRDIAYAMNNMTQAIRMK